MKGRLAAGGGTVLVCLAWVLMTPAGTRQGSSSGRGTAATATAPPPTPTFSARAYRVRAGRYVTVLVHTHQQIDSQAEACQLTLSGPRSRARSFLHADITGDFELTFATADARSGPWRLTESCQARGGASSLTARASVLVDGGHARGVSAAATARSSMLSNRRYRLATAASALPSIRSNLGSAPTTRTPDGPTFTSSRSTAARTRKAAGMLTSGPTTLPTTAIFRKAALLRSGH